MATVTKVKVEYGRTVNLGNYESLRLLVGAEASVEEGEDKVKVADDLQKKMWAIVRDQIALHVKLARE